MTGPSLRVTALGWQGWLVAGPSATVMIDGLLVDWVGRGPATSRISFLNYAPPRRFHWTALPPIDAYVLTHEHEDHFNIPSLAMLDRRIPIWASARVSTAARTILDEMGFAVRYVYPGDAASVGDLRVQFFCDDLVVRQGPPNDEWDTLGFLLTCEPARAGLFSNVDASLTAEMCRAIDERVAAGDHVLACETMEVRSGTRGMQPRSSANPHPPSSQVTRLSDPAAMLAALERGDRFQLLPGQTLILGQGRVVAAEPRAPFLDLADPPAEPHRPFFKRPDDDIAPPACGSYELPVDLTSALAPALAELAAALYGSDLYRRLYSIANRELIGGAAPTFALCLLIDQDSPPWVFEYAPAACGFAPLEDPPEDIEDAYVGVVMLWAADFLALARGELEPRTLGRSLDEVWMLEGYSFQRHFLWTLYHPQRFPDRVLAQYRKQLASLDPAAPVIRWNGQPPA